MDKYKNKYRIQSHRRPDWNYSGEGIYFITLVTQNRECNLGQILNRDGKPSIKLSDFGIIVQNEWANSFQIRQELFCDEYIIMPNHLHAIVVLTQTDDRGRLDDGGGLDGGVGDSHVETHGRASLPSQTRSDNNPNHPPNPNFIRKPRSISSFMAGFKSAVNSKIDDFIDAHQLNVPKFHRNNHFFQPNYYDHIIRNEGEYQRIKTYIINNPSRWHQDKFNPSKETHP